MDKKYSGVSWCTLFLLQEIIKQDRENEYVLFYNSGRDISAQLPKFEQGNVKVIATRYPNKIFNYFLQKILKWPKIDKLLGGVDVFWSPHLNFTALSKDTKHILTIHDLSFLLTPEFFSLRKNVWHKILNAKKIIASADVIIAISENTKRDIIKLTGVSEKKIRIIHDGIGSEMHPVGIADEKLIAIKNKYNLPDKFILYLGTIEPRKNISALISAFEQIADQPEMREFKLVIVGYDGWKNKEVYRAINYSKFKNRLILIGYIENSEKIYFYNLCTIFCYPSFYEGFGLPILEAMACGAPVIASNLSSMPEVAGNAALLIDPADENTISQAIFALAGDKKLQELYSSRGIERAKLFSWKKSAEKWLKMLSEICQN
jgi:glycosyltransferase involved in cell wall biosynthesis